MPDEAVDLFSQQAANRRRSRWLIVAFVLFFAWLGFGGDAIAYLATRGAGDGAYRHAFPFLGIVMTALGAGLAAYAYRTGPEKVLWSTGAREIFDPQNDDERRLVNVVDEMAIASGIPRPGIWLVPDDDPNAFATGRDERGAHIAVTEGLLKALDRDELQAVVAHEMGHVKNLDVRLMTLLAALVGAVALISNGIGRSIRFRGLSVARGGRGRKGGGLGPVLLVLLALWLLSWLLAPIVTRLLALGVSRKREYLADAMSAQFTRNPLALASALEKIERAAAPTSSIRSGSAHLCIADPLGRKLSSKQGVIAELFGTHPPMALRVARLRAMGYQAGKRAARDPQGEPTGA